MNMKYLKSNNNSDYIEGIYFGDLLKNSNIQNYLRNKVTPNNNKLKLNMSYDERCEYLLNQILFHKIYDLKNSTIMSSKIDKTVDCIPIYNKEYEKRYDIGENIYISENMKVVDKDEKKI